MGMRTEALAEIDKKKKITNTPAENRNWNFEIKVHKECFGDGGIAILLAILQIDLLHVTPWSLFSGPPDQSTWMFT